MTNQNDWNTPNNLQTENVPGGGMRGTITKGMDVYDTMDAKIGSVAEVYANVGAAAGTSSFSGSGTATGYFKVDQGGVLGLGATELYIPFSAVQMVDAADNRLTLNCTKARADDMYQNQPAGLDTNS